MQQVTIHPTKSQLSLPRVPRVGQPTRPNQPLIATAAKAATVAAAAAAQKGGTGAEPSYLQGDAYGPVVSTASDDEKV